MPDVLTLTLRTRPADPDGSRHLPSERVFYDFVVNGGSLLDHVARHDPADADMTSVLTVNWPLAPGAEDLAPLLGAAPSPLGDGRVPLYVCRLCGDLGCGALSAVLALSPGVVTWTDFGWGTGAEVGTEGLTGLGPFSFDRAQYRAALASAPEFARPRPPEPPRRWAWRRRRTR